MSLASQVLALATRIGQEIKLVRTEIAAAGGGYRGQTTADFGTEESDLVTVAVPAAWVNASSKIMASVALEATADHDAEDAMLEGLTVGAGNVVPGVGFEIIARAPNMTFGTYKINWTGV